MTEEGILRLLEQEEVAGEVKLHSSQVESACVLAPDLLISFFPTVNYLLVSAVNFLLVC